MEEAMKVRIVKVTHNDSTAKAVAALRGAADVLLSSVGGVSQVSGPDFYREVDEKGLREHFKYLSQGHRDISNEVDFVYRIDGGVAGVAGVWQSPFDAKVLWLPFVSVRPEFKNKGVGTALAKAVAEYANRQGKMLHVSSYSTEGRAHLKKVFDRLIETNKYKILTKASASPTLFRELERGDVFKLTKSSWVVVRRLDDVQVLAYKFPSKGKKIYMVMPGEDGLEVVEVGGSMQPLGGPVDRGVLKPSAVKKGAGLDHHGEILRGPTPAAPKVASPVPTSETKSRHPWHVPVPTFTKEEILGGWSSSPHSAVVGAHYDWRNKVQDARNAYATKLTKELKKLMPDDRFKGFIGQADFNAKASFWDNATRNSDDVRKVAEALRDKKQLATHGLDERKAKALADMYDEHADTIDAHEQMFDESVERHMALFE